MPQPVRLSFEFMNYYSSIFDKQNFYVEETKEQMSDLYKTPI